MVIEYETIAYICCYEKVYVWIFYNIFLIAIMDAIIEYETITYMFL